MKRFLVMLLALALMLTSLVVTVSAEEEPITMSLLVRWENENEFDPTIFEELADALGVTFEYVQVEDKEKILMLLVSEDYPEVLTNPNFTNSELMKYGTEDGYLIPLNDLLDEYAPTLTSRLDEHEGWRDMITMPDGNIYGIPSADNGGGGHGDVNYKLWIDTAWVEAVGMEMPTTLDGLRELLVAFKEKDPNGNGIADEIGLTGATGTWAADTWYNLMNAFGYFDESNYYVKDGKVVAYLKEDYVREGLSYINKMYEDGLIDPGSFTQDLDTLGTVGNAETLIAGAVTCGHIGMYFDINNYDRFKTWTNISALTGPNGYCAIPCSKAATISGSDFSITDVCQHPDIAMKLADLVASEEWTVRHQVGIKGVDWDDADEGTFAWDGETPASYKYLNYTVSASNGENNKWGWTLRLLESPWKQKFQLVGDIYDASNYEAYLSANTDKLRPYAADVDVVPPLSYENADDADELSTLQTNVSGYVKNAVVEFITGTRDIDDDAAWETFQNDIVNMGYDDMCTLLQSTLDYMNK